MERSSTPGSYQGNRIFPYEDKGTRWTRQVHKDEEGGDDRSRSKGNNGNTRAKKEQNKRGEDRKGDKVRLWLVSEKLYQYLSLT